MWDLFRSKLKCPIDSEQQQWIDGRFEWLLEQFGREMPSQVRVILPTREDFPDPYDGTPQDAQTMMARVAEYMNVDPDQIELFLYSEANPLHLTDRDGLKSGSAGLYMHSDTSAEISANRPRRRIGIEEGQLADPMALVGTLAHEIGHEILLGQGRISPEEPDHEPLTDLLTVFLGMGIFTANATIIDRGWTSGGWSGWKTGRQGYLDQRNFGYAHARFAWERGEISAPWFGYLRADVRAPFNQSLRFLAANRSAKSE